MISELKQRIFSGENIAEQEALALANYQPKEELYAAANEIREHFKGTAMDMCSILNARSGKCSEDCKWCSQSVLYKTNIEEYELIHSKLAVQRAIDNADKGVHRFSLVTSGRALSNRNLEELCVVYKNIHKESTIHLCASMGLLNKKQLQKLKDCGVKHYHCNIETAPSFFPKVCSSHTIEEKIKTIKAAQEIGLKVCSGGIIGMGETMAQRIEMALLLRDLHVESIPVNILMPVPGTPMEKTVPLSDEEILTTLALFRFIHPKANIRLAGGRMKIAHIQHLALKSGVSAALVGDYLTTIGSNINEDKENFTKAGFSL